MSAAAQYGPPRDRTAARRRAAWRRRRLIAALMSPWIAGFTVFFGYPLLASVYLSFTHYDLLSPPRWVGLDNYRFMLHSDPRVWPAIRNTLWIIAVSVPARVIFGIGIALMLARVRRGAGVARTIIAATPKAKSTWSGTAKAMSHRVLRTAFQICGSWWSMNA